MYGSLNGGGISTAVPQSKSSFRSSKKKVKILILSNSSRSQNMLFHLISTYEQSVKSIDNDLLIEKGYAAYNGFELELVKAPAMYMRSPSTKSEKMTHQLIIDEDFDLLITIVNEADIKRMADSTRMLLETELPVIMIVNVKNQTENAVMKSELQAYSQLLSVPVLSISFQKHSGTADLINLVGDYIL